MNIIINKKWFRMKRAKKLRFKLRLLNTIRLVVHRTSRHIYAQIIDTDCCTVLASASTLDRNIRDMLVSYPGNIQSAGLVGKIIAKKAISKGISVVSFDRSGFKYHGRIKKLADSARQTGLKF